MPDHPKLTMDKYQEFTKLASPDHPKIIEVAKALHHRNEYARIIPWNDLYPNVRAGFIEDAKAAARVLLSLKVEDVGLTCIGRAHVAHFQTVARKEMLDE